MGELLTRLSKLHSVFSDHLFADITLSDIGDALRSVLDATSVSARRKESCCIRMNAPVFPADTPSSECRMRKS